MTLLRIFWTMMLAGLSAVGGAHGTIAVAQASWVGAGLLSPAAFAWAVALGQLTPGPLSVLVVALGWQISGPTGAAVALLGVSLPTWAVSILAARGLRRFREVLTPLMVGVPWVVIGMVLATGIRMTVPLRPNLLEGVGVAVSAVIAGSGKVEAYWIIGGGALVGLLRLLFF